MTAATITPEETVLYAGAVLRVALPLLGDMPVPAGRQAIVNALKAGFALVRLDRALDDFCLLATREICWERFYPELGAEADPHEAALRKAADETEDRAENLIRAMARCGIRADDVTTGGTR